MLRSLALVLVLVPAAVGGYLVVAQNQPGSATSERAAPILTAAARVIEAQHRSTGSYAGVQIGVGGVRVVRADAESYCIEALGMHLAGPGGQPAPAAC